MRESGLQGMAMANGHLLLMLLGLGVICGSLLLQLYKRKRNDEGMSLGEDAIPDDGSCCPPLLPKHKIFLSHSGKQKWFVEKLCEDLEAWHRFPFFDKRPSSLPKGERFPKLILEAAEQCELAVVVVSEEFLTSKWPMIELSTFVRALSGSNQGLKILPLFFGMSVSDLGSPSKQAAWMKVWEKWARDDPRMKCAEFEEALKMMRSFNGIVFNGDMNNLWSYERDVVESICSVVGADVKWEDSHVQGRSSMCEATRDKIKAIKPEKNGIRVFGYYGMGGIGKTTMCKTLCNELSEFSGKVCHVELGGTRSVEQMLKEVLKKLTNTSEEVLQRLDEGECRSILKNRSSWRQRTFLAIDNVWDDNESMEQAKMFMQDAAFHEGSVVMVTSRCQRTLRRVGVVESHCFGVPELGEADARKLFLHHVAGGKCFSNEEDNMVIDQCIARCRFRKNTTQGCHYLPLALKMLGMHLGFVGSRPAEWLEGFLEVRDFNRFEGDNPVFSIIRLNFDRLPLQLQALFMDVAVFQPSLVFKGLDGMGGYFGWLSDVHGLKLQEIQSQLQQLKERGLLENVDIKKEEVSMHDLYKEFAEMEAKGKLNSSAGLNNRKWMYSSGRGLSNLEKTPGGGCYENLIRVRVEIGDDYYEVDFNVQRIQWRYFANLMVLSLYIRVKVTGVLNVAGLQCLRSLELLDFGGPDGVDGLKDLNYLTYVCWTGNSRAAKLNGSTSLGQLSTSLKILKLAHIDVCLRSNMFDHCTNLLELSLYDIGASGQIDLRQSSSLRSVELSDIGGLQTLLVSSTGLQSLSIWECLDLRCILGLRDLVRLKYLDLSQNPLMEGVLDLHRLTSLQHLELYCGSDETCEDGSKRCQIVELCGLGSLEQLRKFFCSNLDAKELPNLNALKHLEDLSVRECKKLTLLEGVEGLLALRDVNLLGCSSLSRLPDLSNSTKLEMLDLCGTGIELHEEDIGMLAALPGLRLVRIGLGRRFESIELNAARRKVLRRSGLDNMIVTERDLETLPIQLENYEF